MVKSQRTETDAYKASSEIMGKLHSEDSLFYKPWQLADYEICSATLKTTYEEIYIWGRQEAMIRPGWKVEAGRVSIPNVFAKISGVHDSIKQYRKEMKLLKKQPNTLFYFRFPLYRVRTAKKLLSRNYYSVLDKNKNIDKNKLMAASFWKYRFLRTAVQRTIADRIEDFCMNEKFKNIPIDNNLIKPSILEGVTSFLKTLDININLNPTSEDPGKIKIFDTLINIDEPFLKLISQFDYPHLVPKIIVYNNGDKYSKITFEDAVKLMFMSSMGADVIVYNPAGYNDIEDFIDEKYYDIHRLEKTEFNLPYSSWFLF